MAEIAGLAASVIAITAAASTALKISKRMYGMARQVNAAADEIEIFAHDMRLFNTSVELGLRSVNRLCTKLKPSSEMYQYLQREEVMRHLAKSSKLIGKRMDEVWDTAASLQSKRKLVTHVKWVFKKTDVLALRPEMESLKSNLQLIVTLIAIHVGISQLDGDLPESFIQDKLEEMWVCRLFFQWRRNLTNYSAQLKKEVKIHIQTIAILQQSEERRWDREMKAVERPQRRRPKPCRLQELLIDLGSSMVAHEQVPWSNDISPSSPATSSRAGRSYVSATSTSTAASSAPATNSESSIPSNGPSQKRSSIPSVTLNPKPLRVRNEQDSITNEENHNRMPPLQPVSQAPSLRRRRQRISTLPPQPDPTPPVPSEAAVVSAKAKQTHYSSVKPTSSYLQCFNGSGSMRSEPGFIAANGERIPTTANLDPECPQNLISIAHAARLGLVIEPHNAADEDASQAVTIAFPNGEKIKSSGEVTFQWSAGSSSHKPPFNVRCFVYEHDIRNLVLGRPFLDRRQRYWNGGEDKDGGEWMR
ncbi:hypothetical protein IFR05_008538 [Cadophora sp. M221]|nr:hypothetical protein IFR05_008538 [Cadophora sp. M221]